MSLSKYKEKRSFNITPEPDGGKPAKKVLRFVIQKHAASHLHYDFRLEMQGVLKSWAVPKGPALDTAVKRLAMMVEDHPYDYRNFEGIIPAGQYGGGKVIIWDEGTYEAEGLEGKSKAVQEEHLLAQLESGNIKFTLKGKKLKGGFALVRINGKGENTWLLIKHHDDYSGTADITLQDRSVVSGKTLDELNDSSAGPAPARLKAAAKAEHTESVDKAIPEINGAQTGDDIKKDVAEFLSKAETVSFPGDIKPMLATLVGDAFDSNDWAFEVKWDGYRALAYVNDGQADLLSRNNKSFNDKFYSIYQLLKTLKIKAVFDGEIVVLTESGVSDFGKLQNWRSEADGELVYYVFDILWLDGKDLTLLPLYQRQAILTKILPLNDDRLRQSIAFKSKGLEFFKAATEMGLEGMVAKNLSSSYTPDLRSKDWLKIKVHKRQEVVIAGYTRNDDTPKQFSSLLLGVYDKGELIYTGKVGTGFSDKDQQAMMKQFKPLVTDKSPFVQLPDFNKPSRFRPKPAGAKAVWLKPELVCEVTFAEITTDGVFRHPSFQGMRIDKKATAVIREIEMDSSALVKSTSRQEKEGAKVAADLGHGLQDTRLVKPGNSASRKTFLNPKDETQVRKICGHELKLTNLSKIYWPGEKITKRDLLNYYYQVAEFIIPYLKDRPLSLNRFPGGITAPSFYQKDVTQKAPDWAHTFPYQTSTGEHKKYLVGNDEATLLWMCSLGCIEMNPWFSRVETPDYPDYCVIDLDPDKNTFDEVIQVALAVKKILDELGVESFPKTSGSTGMHIYMPLGGKYTYDQSQLFAKIIVTIVQSQLPEITSIERFIKNRNGKMYLDFLQNRPGATIAGPYSLRPKPGATVSMPLHWNEVRKGLKMRDFNILNSLGRLNSVGDLFSGVLGKGIDLEKVIAKAESSYQVK